MRPFISVFMVSIFVSYSLPAWSQDTKNPLASLREGHPRLILLDKDIAPLQARIKSDKTLAQYRERLVERAENILDKPLVEYKLVGPRLLTQSRNCLDRIYTLGLLYKLDGDERYWKRIREEIMAAAGFKDWNPSHFLDTAEMTHAIGIAYDWFYDEWSQEDRETIREAIIDKGLKPALEGYKNDAWYFDNHHNWNQVCNGGISIGALAIAEDEPQMAKTILSNAIEKLPYALRSYAPDGGWEEGPAYWHYATRYTVYALAAYRSALGTDFFLSNSEGLEHCGFFYLHAKGPTGLSFNYADAGARVSPAHELFWLAQRYDQPVLAWYQRDMLASNPSAISALDLIWYTDRGSDPETEGVPRNVWFDNIDVAFQRSQWNNPDAIFVGFKGGDNQANHSHLDLGCFVLDALGIRWAIDLGSDDYNLPGYFGRQRWTYFRLNTQSHNTLIVNGENQATDAKAPIVAFADREDYSYVMADLGQAYDGTKLMRCIVLHDRQRVIVQDEFTLPGRSDVTWQFLTDADVITNGQLAVLRKDGKQMRVRILHPETAVFTVANGNPKPPQRQHKNAQLLQVNLEGVQQGSVAVQFEPQSETGRATTWTHRPLAEW